MKTIPYDKYFDSIDDGSYAEAFVQELRWFYPCTRAMGHNHIGICMEKLYN